MSAQTISDDQKDCLQELINVSMGMASDKLARFLGTFVEIQVPNIALVGTEEIAELLTGNYGDGAVSLVSQGFSASEGIRGEALLIYSKLNADEIAALLGYTDDEVTHSEQLTDISSILTTTFLAGFAEQLETSFSYSAPRVVMLGEQNLAEHLQQRSFNWEFALKVKISYKVVDHAFNCDMVLLIPGSALEFLKDLLDRILAEF